MGIAGIAGKTRHSLLVTEQDIPFLPCILLVGLPDWHRQHYKPMAVYLGTRCRLAFGTRSVVGCKLLDRQQLVQFGLPLAGLGGSNTAVGLDIPTGIQYKLFQLASALHNNTAAWCIHRLLG